MLVITAVPLIALCALVGLALPSPWGVVPVIAAVAFVAISWSVEWGRYRAWGWCEREEDLLVKRGLMFQRLSVVPYGRMQFIDVSAGPVDRVFGLATVQLHTAAAASDARIPGLLLTDAQQLRDRLAGLGEARASGL